MTVEELLEAARARISPVSPAEAAAARDAGAVLVDIRPHAFRAAEGEIDGALVVERNVLEWRLAPDSEWRLPEAGADVRVVLFCNDGYASTLAADVLRQLGVVRATDVAGGFRAWAAAGLPTVPGGSPAVP